MMAVGIDIGSRTTKAVILSEHGVEGYAIIRTQPEAVRGAKEALAAALQVAGLEERAIACIVATGYGRVTIPFAAKQISEISCHTRGVKMVYPGVRTILDMGGQDCKAISCDEKGNVVNFVMNDKCAAGTGRFIEVIADVFDIALEDFGPMSFQAKEAVSISSICSVFARSEALLLAREGVPRPDIIAGIHDALVNRVLAMLRRIQVLPDFVITGGIAKNAGFVKRIERLMGMAALLPPEPQITGAMGAAGFAREEMAKMLAQTP